MVSNLVKFVSKILVKFVSNKIADHLEKYGRFSHFQYFRYLALILLFSVMDGFGWFRVGSLYKSIELMLEFLKAPLVLHFSYYTLTTFLLMLSVISYLC